MEEMRADTSRVVEPEPPRRGELSMSGVGSHSFVERFRASARLCQDPRFLQLTVQTDSLDTIFLFYLPESDDAAVGDYAVARSTDDLFQVGSVRLGLQLIRGRTGSVFRGMNGFVTISRLDGRMSGTFESVIQEEATEAVTKIRGRFASVRVHDTPESECALTAATFVDADSLEAVPPADPGTL